jgi:hypothetical protein
LLLTEILPSGFHLLLHLQVFYITQFLISLWILSVLYPTYSLETGIESDTQVEPVPEERSFEPAPPSPIAVAGS